MPRLTVCLSFDFDGMSDWIGTMKSNNPSELSRGEFGAIGMPRVLDLLEHHGIKATFFVPGHTALAYPDLVRRARDEGHEIGHHGWVHENPANFDLDGERSNFQKGLDCLDKVAGVVPRGYRSPAADFSVNTIDVLQEFGMVYDSSCSGSDFSPYYLRKGDRWSPDTPYVFGEPIDLVEIPFSWGLDDFTHFEFAMGWTTDQSPPSAVREIWQGEFDYALANEPGGVFGVCMHPEVIGRGHRMTMLDGLVEYMKAKDGIVFETYIEYAERWKQANGLEEWTSANPVRSGANAISTL
ncbi:MAG: peptidoglycan-N-acetylglucosamine deacetylase [Gaiellaceae bacterium]|jgi:peptidoglycan/xylan/chitin deacetylase (PgdA/CDA1 family)|nr:peptidoglycan-N-acetylglucosamine deacetylase [Gaiellaceae bacterium]